MMGAYNIIAQEVTLTFAILTLMLMLRSNPRKTENYYLNFYGIISSIAAIFLFRAVFQVAFRSKVFQEPLFLVLLVLYYVVYIMILNLLFLYINFLSTKRRKQKRQAVIMRVVISCVYFAVFLALLLSKHMYAVTDGRVTLLPGFQIYLYLGMTEALLITFATMSHYKTMSRAMRGYIGTFVPLDVLLLIVQRHVPQLVFSSITYVFPFVLVYMLFHSNIYDEISGAQNLQSFITRFEEYSKSGKQFIVLTARFPKESFVELYNRSEIIDDLVAAKCREIESIRRKLYLYTLNDSTYALIAKVRDDAQADQIVEAVDQVLQAPLYNGAVLYTTTYKLVVLRQGKKIECAKNFGAFINYLIDNRMSKNNETEIYTANEQDYVDFEERLEVDQLVLGIRYRGDLDDPHVLCFAQPIYNVETKQFRTAEALMRLQVDGKMIFPDKFIPAAERNNCIHTLTCIILNKVCKQIKELEEKYDFDAVTVNCSSIEFADPNLHQEILNIIRSNRVPTSKICLELTESAMFGDDRMVQHNIQKLREAGVQFYLDDFGTGYSNLERIVTCPFKTIKFDKSLLYHALKDEAVDDLISNMIKIFEKQGFGLLVEGVEDERQRDYSIGKGFHYIQGYNYAKPQPIAQLADYFTKAEV